MPFHECPEIQVKQPVTAVRSTSQKRKKRKSKHEFTSRGFAFLLFHSYTTVADLFPISPYWRLGNTLVVIFEDFTVCRPRYNRNIDPLAVGRIFSISGSGPILCPNIDLVGPKYFLGCQGWDPVGQIRPNITFSSYY